MTRALAGIFVAVSAAVLLASACGGDDDDATPTATPAEASTEQTVSMVDNVFVPDTLIVPVGVPVTFTAKNDGQAVHNMLITVDDAQFSSDLLVGPGESSTFEATFPHPGEYNFVCGLHLPDMAGTITAR